ncbi:MAG: ABC transporter permease [Planctomycetes bacterium]|nr:ABC transporter permease [Planctomycetota bacterium]
MNTLRSIIGMAALAWRGLVRRATRSALVLAGVAVAVFLFCTVEAMRSGVERATQQSSGETALVVYRQNRFCPFTSQLPQSYEQAIGKIPGVASVTPVKIVVSNCRASLDVVTFRGVPPEDFAATHASSASPESMKSWLGRGDSALIGRELAHRRRLKPGDRFTAAGIDAFVAGIIESDEPQDQSSAFVHLPFLQEQAKRGGTGGVVTQFDVRVTDPARLDEVAQAIDRQFARDQSPTTTRAETAHVARAATDVIVLVRFAEALGLAALLAVFALVANAIVLSMRSREKEISVLQTLGFRGVHLAALVLLEACLLGGVGGLVGAVSSYATVSLARTAMTMEGVSIAIPPSAGIAITGVAIAIGLSMAAGVVPAILASRQTIVAGFRS